MMVCITLRVVFISLLCFQVSQCYQSLSRVLERLNDLEGEMSLLDDKLSKERRHRREDVGALNKQLESLRQTCGCDTSTSVTPGQVLAKTQTVQEKSLVNVEPSMVANLRLAFMEEKRMNTRIRSELTQKYVLLEGDVKQALVNVTKKIMNTQQDLVEKHRDLVQNVTRVLDVLNNTVSSHIRESVKSIGQFKEEMDNKILYEVNNVKKSIADTERLVMDTQSHSNRTLSSFMLERAQSMKQFKDKMDNKIVHEVNTVKKSIEDTARRLMDTQSHANSTLSLFMLESAQSMKQFKDKMDNKIMHEVNTVKKSIEDTARRLIDTQSHTNHTLSSQILDSVRSIGQFKQEMDNKIVNEVNTVKKSIEDTERKLIDRQSNANSTLSSFMLESAQSMKQFEAKMDNKIEHEVKTVKQSIADTERRVMDTQSHTNRTLSSQILESVRSIGQLKQEMDNKILWSIADTERLVMDTQSHANSTLSSFMLESAQSMKQFNEKMDNKIVNEVNTVKKSIEDTERRVMDTQSNTNRTLSSHILESVRTMNTVKKSIADTERRLIQDITNDITENERKCVEKITVLIKRIEQTFNQTLSTLELSIDVLKLPNCPGSEYASGVYLLSSSSPILDKAPVYCDTITDGGGWLVFQRRQDGTVDFFRNWMEYKQGFGNLTTEFWWGLEKLHAATRDKPRELRIELEDFSGNTAYAHYTSFSIASESDKYALSVSGYSGTAGDGLRWHNGAPFSTKDRDHNTWYYDNCALRRTGAWWFRHRCLDSHLNGKYRSAGGSFPRGKGPVWFRFNDLRAVKLAEMKLR